MCSGVRVRGLLAVPGRPPHVTGVRTDGAEVKADLVLDATGRRSPIDRWLEDVGARPTASSWAECGLAYYSRHYRLRPSVELPGIPTTRIVAGFDEFTVAVFGADNGTMQVAVAPLASDRRFRAVKDPDVFTAVLRTVPAAAAWLGVLEPFGPVFQMAGLHNTLRRLVVDSDPVATGLHVIGDSRCTTNPTLGRGLSLALWGAVDLVETIAAHGGDNIEQAMALDRSVADHVVPFYEDQAIIDLARLKVLRHTVEGGSAPETTPIEPDRVSFTQLRTASLYDPVAFRAFWRLMGMMCVPDDVYTDPAVVARTHEILRRRDEDSGPAPPTRDQLAAAFAT